MRRYAINCGNVMPQIAYSLTEDDIKALAHFMSRQSGQ
jgi:cytochrome c553